MCNARRRRCASADGRRGRPRSPWSCRQRSRSWRLRPWSACRPATARSRRRLPSARARRVGARAARGGGALRGGGEGRAGVEIAPPLLGGAGGEEDLPGGEAVALKRFGIRAGGRALADRRCCLALLEAKRPGRQVENAPAEGNGAGG